ncbi:hypothetical protein SKAU_G00064950 [Synaphobranchus kaupii]|uniref:Uncharacterized protein n=1 Tax=Synaphobranchus kaupii TaxID=118154 RepID=A0A9Q1JB54_SYNKA|nr:hypothetical protein SKAU_G00064950 [Synaphobranchus kaupii]
MEPRGAEPSPHHRGGGARGAPLHPTPAKVTLPGSRPGRLRHAAFRGVTWSRVSAGVGWGGGLLLSSAAHPQKAAFFDGNPSSTVMWDSGSL